MPWTRLVDVGYAAKSMALDYPGAPLVVILAYAEQRKGR